MFSQGKQILAVIAAIAPFAGVHSTKAADFAGSVQGVVKTASGQALPGAYGKLFNPERRLTFMVISEAQGRYALDNLPPGNYTVQGIGNGFQSKPTPLTLTADKPATADVALTDNQGDQVIKRETTIIDRRPFRIDGIRFIDEREQNFSPRESIYRFTGLHITADEEAKTAVVNFTTHREPLTNLTITTTDRNFSRRVEVLACDGEHDVLRFRVEKPVARKDPAGRRPYFLNDFAGRVENDGRRVEIR